MSDNEVLSAEQLRIAIEVAQDGVDAGDKVMNVSPDYVLALAASHEALRAERDAFRVGDEIARRHADGWHPVFHVDPAKYEWVHWPDDATEPMTPAEVDWYHQRWAERQARAEQ